MVERAELVGHDAIVIVVLVHLQRVDAQSVLGRHGVAQSALRAAGKVPRLLALAVGRARVGDGVRAIEPFGPQQFGVGLLVVPNVRVSVPHLGAVFVVVAGHPHMVQDARFQASDALGVAPFHLQRKRLHQHRAVGESPTGGRAGRRLWVGDHVELDLRVARQREKSLLHRAIGPKRRIDRVGNQARGGNVILGRGEDAGLAELLGKLRRLVGNFRCGNQSVDAPSREIDKVDFPLGVLGNVDDTDLRVAQLAVLGHAALFVPQHPDFAGVVVAVDIGAAQLRQPRAVVDPAAGERAEVGVRMLDEGLQNRRRALGSLRAEGMAPFAHAPAVVAPLLDDAHHFPQVLPDFARPKIARRRVEAELPHLAVPVRPDFGPRIGDADERIVGGDRVFALVGRVVDVDPQHRAQQISQVLAGLQFVGNAASVARGQVEISIGPESHAAAVVAAGGPLEYHGF